MVINICGIYKVANTITGDFYLGSSCNIKRRMDEHRRTLSSGNHRNCHLQRAWNKYGADNFNFSIILLCAIEHKLYYEQTLLDGLKPAYNIAICAEASFQGLHHTKETKHKLSEAKRGNAYNLGRKLIEEHKRKISETSKGKHVPSEETRYKLRKAQEGKHLSEETRRKISEAQKEELNHNFGKHFSEEHKHKIGEANKGKHVTTEETKHKMSEAWKTRPSVSEETRRKMSESATLQWAKRKSAP